MQEAMLLRVNQNSVFGKALVALLKSEDGLSKDELNTIGGMKRAAWGINVAKIWFDNLIVDRVADNYTASYINVVPDSSGYYLRVNDGSDLGRALRFLLDTGTQVHEDDLAKAAGKERVRWCLKSVSDWFDNLSINITSTDSGKYFTASYMDVAPKSAATVVVDKAKKSEGGKPVDPIRWPEAPALIGTLDKFDKPRFFDKMARKVERGMHISLESPPGVGKDTAVMELAAQQGKVLVVVPGDGGLRRRHLEGSQELQNGSSYFKVAEFAAAAVNGWWALVTELNAADPDVLMYLNALMAPPYMISIHGKSYPVHPDFRLFVTYNANLIGTKLLPQSTKSRFTPFKMRFFTEAQLKRRLVAMGMPDEPWADWVVQFGLRMWQSHENGTMRYQIDVRRLADAVDSIVNDEEGLRDALKDAVLDTIDSPVEYKAAEAVLRDLVKEYEYQQTVVKPTLKQAIDNSKVSHLGDYK